MFLFKQQYYNNMINNFLSKRYAITIIALIIGVIFGLHRDSYNVYLLESLMWFDFFVITIFSLICLKFSRINKTAHKKNKFKKLISHVVVSSLIGLASFSLFYQGISYYNNWKFDNPIIDNDSGIGSYLVKFKNNEYRFVIKSYDEIDNYLLNNNLMLVDSSDDIGQDKLKEMVNSSSLHNIKFNKNGVFVAKTPLNNTILTNYYYGYGLNSENKVINYETFKESEVETTIRAISAAFFVFLLFLLSPLKKEEFFEK